MKTATACKLSEPISTVAEVTATRPRDARSSTIDAPTRREPVDDVLQLALDCGLEIAPHPSVSINWRAVSELGSVLSTAAATTGQRPYAWDDPTYWPIEADKSVRSQLIAVGNALNFRFWRRSQDGTIEALGGQLNGEHFTGSMYLWRRIRLAHDAGIPLAEAEYLRTMNPQRFDNAFADDDGFNPLGEGLGERVANLRDLGIQLITNWNGQFDSFIAQTEGSLPTFMRMSRKLRAYDDPIGKLSFVNALMLRGSGLAKFEQELLPAIDYQLLKQLLRQGVLLPGLEMATKIRSHRLLDDDEALQLRSAALEALLVAGRGAGISGDLVDNQLWLNRTVCADVRPRCAECKFAAFCLKDAEFQRPLQITRYY